MTKITILILISLLCFQLVYSFLFPSCGSSDNWQPISTYVPKFQAEYSDNLLLAKIYPLISEDYRLNSDTGHYLELGRNFSSEYFKGSPFLERPLYPFLIFLFSLPVRLLVSPSYGIIFGVAILVNLILMSAALLLFFHLISKIISLKAAWLSSILLIFSPFLHSFLNQPLAEMLMVFTVVFSAYLIYNYAKKPSTSKLIVFSLIVGVFMLGKMFFAISFFILILALCFRRYKEGAVFLAVQLVPFLLWYFWITQVWGMNYYSHGVQNWDMGVWVLNMFNWPWFKTAGVLLAVIPDFFRALIFAFLLIPIIFSVIGFGRLPLKSKNVIYFGAFFSVFLLGFLTRYYYIRHVFLLFPIVYPAAALGIASAASYLKKRKSWYSPVFYAIVIGLIIIISNINIYQVFDYNNH